MVDPITVSIAAALEAATGASSDAIAVQRLADLLDRRMRQDPVFAQRLRAIWDEATEAEEQDRVTNTISGEVHGQVIQARDIHGGISFNS